MFCDTTKWIWLDQRIYPGCQSAPASGFNRNQDIRPAMGVFRKTFELEDGRRPVIARFSGDSKYRLYVNGKFVDDGPVEIGGDYGYRKHPGWWFADSRDITEFCHAGLNVIVAEVWNIGLALTDFSQGTPGFILELTGNEGFVVSTDASWRGILNPAFIRQDQYEAWRFPFDYHSPGFDDSPWPFAEEKNDGRKLDELDLPHLVNEPVPPEKLIVPFPGLERQIKAGAAIFPLETTPGIPVVFYLKFGEELAAHLEFEVEAAAQAVIRIEYQENPEYTHYSETYATAKGKHRFRTSRLNAFQYLKITVVHAVFGTPECAPVIIYSLLAFKREFPLPATAGFSCSDPGLVRLRECCDRTLRLCMQRLYLDSPVHQEPSGCTGDYMIEALMSYVLYGETRLAAADLRRTALLLRQEHGKMFHTSYSLMFVMMLRDYYYYTGDMSPVVEMKDAVMLVLHRFKTYIGKEGLISNAPDYLFIDWVVRGDVSYHHPPASHGMGCMTAFYYHALRCAADLYPEEASALQAAAASVREAFNSNLWNEKRGCYIDGIPFITGIAPSQWLPPDEEELSCSVHTNALALAYGLAPEPRIAGLAEKMMTEPSWLQPQMYFMHFVFEALKRAGAFEQYGYALFERWHPVVDEHPSSLKEAWNCGDYSHAWGGTPAYQLIHSVAGLEILEPGFRKIRFKPALGPLKYLHAVIPSPLGNIIFKANGNDIDITVPSGIQLAD